MLQLAPGERAVRDEHVELFTYAETTKMAEIWNFNFFFEIF